MFFILGLVFGLTGCSNLGLYESSGPQARSLPKIPEIKRQAGVPQRYDSSRNSTLVVTSEVGNYSDTSQQLRNTQQQAAARELLKAQAKERATVDIDPYASIPENNSVSVKPTITEPRNSETSPAVKSLMASARADIAIGRSQSAVSKLERGLRIESRNPQLWHLLAKAHYAQSDYQQTISMARKSIRYAADDDLIAQNWKLIKQAGERSGDTTAVKEALDYSKVNP